MKNLLKRLIFGDAVITEYSTVTVAEEIKEKVILLYDQTTLDVTTNHCILCLEPVVFGFWIEDKKQIAELDLHTKFKVLLGYAANKDEKPINRPSSIVYLEFMDKIEEEDGTLFLLKTIESKLFQVGPLKTFLLFYKYYKKPGLSFSKFRSLVSAYSYPRKVRIISFRQDDYFNIFPMDLVGRIGSGKRFVFGLRHTNTTLSKIIETKKMVASEISYNQKDIIYQLGKHHSRNPPSPDMLPFKTINSKLFDFYIPEWAEKYSEINILKTKNLGSHMLLWGEIANETILSDASPHLYHIHFLHYLYQQRNNYAYPLV